eukprot:PhF_6_TR1024/c0_g1_i1/m.2062
MSEHGSRQSTPRSQVRALPLLATTLESSSDGAITVDTLSYLVRGTRDVSYRTNSGRPKHSPSSLGLTTSTPTVQDDTWLTRTAKVLAKKNALKSPTSVEENQIVPHGFLQALEVYSGTSTAARSSMKHIEYRETNVPQEYWIFSETPLCKSDVGVVHDPVSGQWKKRAFPSSNPSSRGEVYALAATLDVMARKIDTTVLQDAEKIFGVDGGESLERTLRQLHEVHNVGLAEIVRQCYVTCAERGVLLDKIRCVYSDVFESCLSVVSYLRRRCNHSIGDVLDAKTSMQKLKTDCEHSIAQTATLRDHVRKLEAENDLLRHQLEEFEAMKHRDAVMTEFLSRQADRNVLLLELGAKQDSRPVSAHTATSATAVDRTKVLPVLGNAKLSREETIKEIFSNASYSDRPKPEMKERGMQVQETKVDEKLYRAFLEFGEHVRHTVSVVEKMAEPYYGKMTFRNPLEAASWAKDRLQELVNTYISNTRPGKEKTQNVEDFPGTEIGNFVLTKDMLTNVMTDTSRTLREVNFRLNALQENIVQILMQKEQLEEEKRAKERARETAVEEGEQTPIIIHVNVGSQTDPMEVESVMEDSTRRPSISSRRPSGPSALPQPQFTDTSFQSHVTNEPVKTIPSFKGKPTGGLLEQAAMFVQHERKDEITSVLRAQNEQLNRKIEDLEAKISAMSAQLKETLIPHIETNPLSFPKTSPAPTPAPPPKHIPKSVRPAALAVEHVMGLSSRTSRTPMVTPLGEIEGKTQPPSAEPEIVPLTTRMRKSDHARLQSIITSSSKSQARLNTWLLQIITKIYKSRLKAVVGPMCFDMIRLSDMPFPDFFFDYAKQSYGTRKLVDDYCSNIVATMRLHAQDARVELFAKFLYGEYTNVTLSPVLWANKLIEEGTVGPEYGSIGDDLPAHCKVSLIRALYAVGTIFDVGVSGEIVDTLSQLLTSVSQEVSVEQFTEGMTRMGVPPQQINDVLAQWNCSVDMARKYLLRSQMLSILAHFIATRFPGGKNVDSVSPSSTPVVEIGGDVMSQGEGTPPLRPLVDLKLL